MRAMVAILTIVSIFWAGSAFASTYNVTGSMFSPDGTFEISGTMEIADEPDPIEISNGHFIYEVSSFNISFGLHAFISNGQDSSITSIHNPSGPNPSTQTFDTFHLRGTGDMSDWSCLSPQAIFYNSHGDAYDTGADYSDFLSTPHRISYSGVMNLDLNGYGTAYFDSFAITRAVPVPGSFMLLMAGLCCLGFIRKNRA